MKVGFLACAALSAAPCCAFFAPVAPSVAVSRRTTTSSLRYECLVVVEAMGGMSPQTYSDWSTSAVVELETGRSYLFASLCMSSWGHGWEEGRGILQRGRGGQTVSALVSTAATIDSEPAV